MSGYDFNKDGKISGGEKAAVLVWQGLSLAGTASGAYHGYKRNDSIGRSIGWGLLGGMFPFITIPVSIAQGFGKPKRSRRRRSTRRLTRK